MKEKDLSVGGYMSSKFVEDLISKRKKQQSPYVA